MDVAVDKIHDFIRCLGAILPLYQKLTLLQFPHSSIFSLGANAINGATAVYAANVGKPKLYWLNSLVLVVIGSFGGGTLAPLLIGKPSMIVWNDQIIVLCTIAWYATHYLGCQNFLTWLPVKMFWTVFLGLFRTHSVINVLNASLTVLGPTPYYPIPIIGPIVTGTALGCLGMFLPFDKGLAPIKNGTPWNLQGALITATFYHLMVNDKVGFLGDWLRAAVGTYDASTTKMMIATMHIVSLELQVLFNGDANIFTPVHKLLYLVFQVQGPIVTAERKAADAASPSAGWSIASRYRLAGLLEVLRVLIVIGTIFAYVYIKVPPHSLHAFSARQLVASNLALPSISSDNSMSIATYQVVRPEEKLSSMFSDASKTSLQLGETIGSCQLLQSVRFCTPYLMRLEVDYDRTCKSEGAGASSDSAGHCNQSYQLAVYKGSFIDSNSTAVWSMPMPVADRVPTTAEHDAVSALTSPAAVTSTVRGADDAASVSLSLTATGELLLLQRLVGVANNEHHVAVLWSSGAKKCSQNRDSSSNRGGEARLAIDESSGRPVVICSDDTKESL